MKQRAVSRSRTDALAPLSTAILEWRGEYGAPYSNNAVYARAAQHSTAVVITMTTHHVLVHHRSVFVNDVMLWIVDAFMNGMGAAIYDAVS
jgi:hypothetical protein